MMTGRMMLGVFVILAIVGEINCVPPGFANAELRGGAAILLADVDVDDEDILDRYERGVSSGMSSGSPPGMGDNEPEFPDTQLTGKPEIMKLTVVSYVTSRFASTEVRSKLKNLGSEAAEATFTVKLPEDAFISAFSMTIEDVVYHSQVLPKEQAQKQYNEAKAKGQTAGQVKQSSADSTKFTVSVTVAARSSVIFNVTYQQLLRRKDGMFEHRINIQPGQMVPDVRVEVHITETQGLKEVNASWTMVAKSDEDKLNNMTSIQSRARYARVLFDTRGGAAQINAHGIMGEFVVKYDVMHDMKAGHVEIVNGYFVHYFSPVGLPTTRKNVVFVIDTSGSMNGRKMQQTKAAFTTILDDVREIDRFNIVLFESGVQVWRREEMVKATEKNIIQAKTYVNRIQARGGTNMYDGLITGIDLLIESGNDDALPLIIMLSDGQPTSGPVTDSGAIIRGVTEAIEGRLSLFCVGLGSGADYGLLEKLSLSNQGLARKVYEDSSASIQMKGFYDEVANPLLFNVNIEYNNRLVDTNSLTKSSFMAYFDGTEIIVAGKLRDDVISAVWNSSNDESGNTVLTGSGNQSDLLQAQTILASAQRPELISIVDGNESDNLELNVLITAKSLDVDIAFNTSTPIEKERSLNRHEVNDFAQRLWAYLSIKNILEQRKTVDSRQVKDELTAKALDLSLKYHFVTPLTSLLVVKPEFDIGEPIDICNYIPDELLEDQSSLNIHVPIRQMAAPNSKSSVPNKQRYISPTSPRLGPSLSGQFGVPVFPRGLPTSSADSDPHFMVEIPDTGVTVCFDINGNPGDVFNLLDDPKLNLSVSAYVIPANHDHAQEIKSAAPNNTYFGKIGVRLGEDRYLVITTDTIIVSNDAFKLRWDDDLAMRVGEFIVEIRHKRLIISHGSDVVIVVMLHHVRCHGAEDAAKSHRVDHLGFYVEERRGLSDEVHGLIGQFQRKKEVLVMVDQDDVDSTMISKNANATLTIDDRSVHVTRKTRRVPLIRDYRECWHAANNANGLIEGDYADYKLPSLNARPLRKVAV